MKDQAVKNYLPAISCAIVILALSTFSGVRVPSSGIEVDKIGHLIAYGVQNWLLLLGLKWNKRLDNNWMIYSFFLVSLYGILLECVQWAFFPYRFFEVWDMIANIVGALLSMLLFRFFKFKT